MVKQNKNKQKRRKKDSRVIMVLSFCQQRRRWTTVVVFLPCLLIAITLLSIWFLPSSYHYDFIHHRSSTEKTNSAVLTTHANDMGMVPKDLVQLNVYESNDFVNERGIIPVGWEKSNTDTRILGPCQFATQQRSPSSSTYSTIQWKNRRRDNHNTITRTDNETHTNEYYRNADTNDFQYHRRPSSSSTANKQKAIDDGFCRPGFLIIGAGKCGTSSLYHT